jgi:hypothetical protein
LSEFLKGILPATQVFHGDDRLFFVQISLFSCNEEIHASLKKKASLVKAAASSTFFPCGKLDE